MDRNKKLAKLVDKQIESMHTTKRLINRQKDVVSSISISKTWYFLMAICLGSIVYIAIKIILL